VLLRGAKRPTSHRGNDDFARIRVRLSLPSEPCVILWEGMSCGDCIASVLRALDFVDGHAKSHRNL
jgi:hypothetical protein